MNQRLGEFSQWSEPNDPDEILLEIIAARCLGIEYGDPGPFFDDKCETCWGTHYWWLGNTWGVQHTNVIDTELFDRDRLFRCNHDCHEDEMWMA